MSLDFSCVASCVEECYFAFLMFLYVTLSHPGQRKNTRTVRLSVAI